MSARSVLNIHDDARIQEADDVQSLKDEGCITWCVAHTQPLKELVAQQHLLDQGFEVYMPRFKKTVRHARKVEEKLAPLFPRYIFVGMDLSSARWRSVNSTRGISHLLMSNGLKPATIPTRIINDLHAQEIGDGIVPVASLVSFVKGEKVRIVEGAFADQTAIFESMDDKSRVQLLLTFMGREMKMTLPTYAVEAA
ncbi:transcription termination/antitermination protein NusG [Holospora undulata]|uniref:transcription termination/antitermination protein NusG n=1 Tax=Holospora undulata TaxID=1169117 RepID=UPI001F2F249F|nr:transcription termination/antitermination NusG family protein [Holospora undulata]